jgi:hypothetical protein
MIPSWEIASALALIPDFNPIPKSPRILNIHIRGLPVNLTGIEFII